MKRLAIFALLCAALVARAQTQFTATATVGIPFSQTITAGSPRGYFQETGTDGGPLVANALPPGLNYDNATGLLSGTPTTAGSYVITIFQSTSAGQVQTVMNLIVSKAGTSPSRAESASSKSASPTCGDSTHPCPATAAGAASGGSGPYPLPVTSTATNATELDFPSCFSSAYRNYEVIFDNLTLGSTSGTGPVPFGIQLQTGSGYDTSSHYTEGDSQVGKSLSGDSGQTAGQTGINIDSAGVPGETVQAGFMFTGRLYFYDPLSTSVSRHHMDGEFTVGNDNGGGNYLGSRVNVTYTQGSTAVTGFRVYAGGTATFSGTVTCQPLPQ
jgi:hypothetical protein